MKYDLTGIDKWDEGITQLLLKDGVYKNLADIPWSLAAKTSLYLHPTNVAHLRLPLAGDVDVWPSEALPTFDAAELRTVVATIIEHAKRLRAENRKPFSYIERKIRQIKPIADLVMKSLVVPSGKTVEGDLIEAVTVPWFEIIEFLSKNPQSLSELSRSPRKLEEIIAGAYRQAGFENVILTPRSGDLGRDIIAEKRGLGTIRVIDQVKAYSPGHLVTADEVRAMFGVLKLESGTSKAFITTTSDFAPRIKDDALLRTVIPGSIELVNGTELLKRLEAIAQGRI